jgi:hypothetical protein
MILVQLTRFARDMAGYPGNSISQPGGRKTEDKQETEKQERSAWKLGEHHNGDLPFSCRPQKGFSFRPLATGGFIQIGPFRSDRFPYEEDKS